MRGKSVALLVLALGCGLVASLGITQVLAKRGDTAPPSDMVSIYLAKADIAQGTLASDENLKAEQWPKDKVPAGALVRAEDFAGRHARGKIYAGQPILEPMLLPKGEQTIEAQIQKGLRVVPIPVSPESVHCGLVIPGSRVDVQVFIRADASLGIPETMSKTVLQDIKVFAVNDQTQGQQDAADPKSPEANRSLPSARTVSLLVTPSQAEIVTLASQLGSIKLILRSADDQDQPKSKTTTARDVLGPEFVVRTRGLEKQGNDEPGFKKWFEAVRDMLKQSTVKGAQEEPRKTFTVRIRNRDEVTDVMMVANADNWTAMNLPVRSRAASEGYTGNPGDAPTSVVPALVPVAAPGLPAKPQSSPQPVFKVTGPPPLGG